jgi:Tfp pilus assembly protein PilV
MASMRVNHTSSDRGSALVMAVIVSVVVLGLSGVLLTFANHQSSSSNSDRQRQQAIDAAMAGLVVADSALTTGGAYADSGVLKSFPGGGAEYKVTVTNDPAVASGFGRIVTSVSYAPTFAAPKQTRTVQQLVVLDPVGGGGFKYAIYSTGVIETKSPVLCSTTPGPCADGNGGMFSSGAIKLLGDGQTYSGDVTTTGDITTGQNLTINGTLRSGGSISINGSSSHVYGDVYAGNVVPIDGVVHGKAMASGSIYNYSPGCTSPTIAAHVTGLCQQYTTPPAIVSPVQPNPVFSWKVENYPAGVTGPMNGPAFVTLVNKVDAKGVYWIDSNNIAFPSNGALWLTGDLTIYSPASTLLLPPVVLNKTAGPVQLTIIGLNGISAPSLTIPDNVLTLLYGGTSNILINSTTSAVNRPITGVVYNKQGQVTFGANSSITFAPVAAPGFNFAVSGGATSSYAIHNISTREINNITP